MKWLPVRFLLMLVVAGAMIVAIAILATPKAHASRDHVRIEVYWTGSYCIDIQQATGQIETKCGYNATFTGTTGPGRTIGVDPIMGAADYISCQFYLNGDLEYRDFAVAGDYTDVNCILDIYSKDGSYV